MSLPKSRVAQQFNRSAADYDRFADLQREMGEKLVREIETFAGEIKTSIQIADLGCGTGSLLKSLVDEGYLQLTGFDIAQSMLVQAAEKCPEFVALTCSDIESLPAADNSFDAIVSNAALQWCESEKVFREIQRILKSKGRAFIKTFGPQTLRQWREAFGQRDQQRIHLLESADQIATSIGKTGLVCLKIESHNVNVEFDSVTAMLNSVRKIGATNAQIQTSSKTISKSDYQSIHSKFEQTISSGKTLLLTYEVITIVLEQA